VTAPYDGLPEALAAVRARISAAGGDPTGVSIVAVTKGHGPDALRAAARVGLSDVGENYAQELLAKAAAGPGGLRWHFIGAVQRNKVATLAPLVDLWHGVDRPDEAQRIGAARPGARILVQVELARGPARAGCPPDGLEALIDALPPTVELRGLMGIGPPGDPEAARPGFRWLAGEARRRGLPEVSMGMSADLEVAVQEGATLLRVGTALFGARPDRGPRGG
jgi:pyridoxal phosphate enzyme (YggS family)